MAATRKQPTLVTQNEAADDDMYVMPSTPDHTVITYIGCILTSIMSILNPIIHIITIWIVKIL